MTLRSVVVLLTLAHAAFAQAPPSISRVKVAAAPVFGVIDSAELGNFVDTLIIAQMAKENIPGAVFVLVRDGKILYQRGYGFANVARRQPVDPQRTIWRIGSISKVFTATAIVQLADRGRFQLTDDVNSYLTRFKVPATFPAPVTFQHLLTHTAGFDEIRPGTRAETAAGVLPLGDFLANKLIRLRPPGRTISYSTYGVTLGGYLVEQVSGLEFEAYLARHIWGPLGMDRSNIVVPASLKADVAQGYEYDNGANKLADWEWYHTTPASSINASAADMARFIIAHLRNGRYGNSRIMSASAALDMHRQHATSHSGLAGFAYGFYEEFANGERLIEHGGNVEGFSAQLTLIPARGIGFFIASQHEPARLRDVVQAALLDHYFPIKQEPLPAVPMAGYRQRAARFAGIYEVNQYCHSCGPGRREYPRIEVKANADGTISITGNPQPLVEVSPLFFRPLTGTGGAVFQEDASGRVMVLAGGSWMVFERIK
jgi:CubicO group peptidase (beta-lactamase class C family)